MNTAWAIGAMTGPSAGGALADAIGDPAPYVLVAAIALLTLLLVNRRGLEQPPTNEESAVSVR